MLSRNWRNLLKCLFIDMLLKVIKIEKLFELFINLDATSKFLTASDSNFTIASFRISLQYKKKSFRANNLQLNINKIIKEIL